MLSSDLLKGLHGTRLLVVYVEAPVVIAEKQRLYLWITLHAYTDHHGAAASCSIDIKAVFSCKHHNMRVLLTTNITTCVGRSTCCAQSEVVVMYSCLIVT